VPTIVAIRSWFNNRRLHSACGNLPPVEYEQQHYRRIAELEALGRAEPSLHRTRAVRTAGPAHCEGRSHRRPPWGRAVSGRCRRRWSAADSPPGLGRRRGHPERRRGARHRTM